MAFGRFRHEDVSRLGSRVFSRMNKKSGSPLYVYEVIREYEHLILPLKKPSTQYCWSLYFQDMITELGSNKMDELSGSDIQQYFTKLSKRVSAATVKTRWIALSAVLNHAVDQGYISGFQRPKLPRAVRNTQQWWSIDEMRTLVERSRGETRIMLMLLVETGCRIGEALGLQTSDLDIASKTLSINRTLFQDQPNSPKTDSSIRTIAISEELCLALDSIKDPSSPSSYIFRTENGKPRKASELLKRFNTLYARVGFSKKGFHAFRRGNITHLVLNLEMPESIVGARVGHLSDGMTLGVYVQKIQGLDKKWINKIAESIYGKTKELVEESAGAVQ